jgi:hypothetical protein
MLSKVTSRLTYANVMATIAVFVALGGGAYAATLAKNSVGTPQLKSNAVISSKVKNRSLLAVDFKAGQLPKGPKGDKGDTGTVDTSNFFTKGESDGRFLPLAGTAANSSNLGGLPPSSYLPSSALQSSGIVNIPTGAPTTLLSRGQVSFTATCTDQTAGVFEVEIFATSSEANSIFGRQSDQVTLTGTPASLYMSTSDAAVLRSDWPAAVITPSTAFHVLVARGVNVGGHNCMAGVTVTP